MQIPLRIMEMLVSKVCHDLISPVSAINNGVELITEVGGDVIEEANKLIATSAEQAARRLKYFRVCYGRAGSESNVTVDDVRAIACDHFVDTKIKLLWPPELRLYALHEQRGGFKMFLNLLLLAEDMLAYGGVIAVLPPLDEAKEIGCRVEVAGRGAALNSMTQSCLEGTAAEEEVTAKTVHAAVTGLWTRYFFMRLHTDVSQSDRVVFWFSPIT